MATGRSCRSLATMIASWLGIPKKVPASQAAGQGVLVGSPTSHLSARLGCLGVNVRNPIDPSSVLATGVPASS